MIEYRKAKSNEREKLIDLANFAFDQDIGSLLPKVYNQEFDLSSLHKVAVDDQGSIRAQVAVLPETLRVCDSTLRVGFVGIVSVHPGARGEGHMKELMNLWLHEISDTCDIAVLWGQRQRYEYFGFTVGGMQYKYIIGDANVRHALKDVDAEGLSFSPLFDLEGGQGFAHRVHSKQLAYVERDIQQLPLIFSSFQQNALGILDKDRLIGYMIVNGTGDEVSELMMEVTSDIERTVKAYMKHMGIDRITIRTSDYDTALNPSLGKFAEEYVIEPAHMYNIFDFANVLKAYLTLKHQTIGLEPGEFSAILDGQPVTICVDPKGVTVDRSATPGAVILNKEQAQTLLLTPHGRFLNVSAPAGWFPLPLYWSKVDLF
ncbi:GNAT family N-acetyltransferase [Paenibacillus sp. sgz5001063]|uniref:GNAT family N-acetyltransferase n=1 Tax=Paenibacillus sp. sgz5001063 TaxID=3242474 RepID=UPI0036D36C30